MWHDSLICTTLLIRCTYAYIPYYHPIDTSHDWFMSVTWLRLYIRRHTYRIIIPWICALRLYPQFLSNVPLSYLWHDPLICTTILFGGYICIHTVLSSHRYARSGFIPSFWAVLCTWNETPHHVRMSHVAYVNELCTLQHTATYCHTLHYRWKDRIFKDCGMHQWVMSLQHAATRCNTLQHTTRLQGNKSCGIHQWVVSLQRAATRCNTLQHIARLQANEPCGAKQWVMSHTWMCHDSQMNTL